MKSVFQEGSSLSNAVQKAWEAAGSPECFEIKVLEQGTYNFFGFNKTPYTVSLTVVEKESNRNTRFSSSHKDSKEFRADRQSRSGAIDSLMEASSNYKDRRNFKKNDSSESNGEKRMDRSDRSDRPDRFKKAESIRPTKDYSRNESNPGMELEADNWTEAYAELAETFFSNILDILGESNSKVVRKNMEKNSLQLLVTNSSENSILDKTFFVSIAPLIVQMVKRSSSESPKGLRIIISNKNDE